MGDRKESEKSGCYVSGALSALAFALIVDFFFPRILPYGLFHFWDFRGSVYDVLMASWPVFAWGAGVNIIYSLFVRNDPEMNLYAEVFLVRGLGRSAVAGIFEEAAFRWGMFYGAIVMVQVVNFLFFGWLGFGIAEWFHMSILAPIADFFTLHYLHDYLRGAHGWAIGAAIIISNGKFRDGHAYQGWFGLVNSWFVGMFFFYIMFTHGLFAAMLVHFLYNAFIYVVRYVDCVIERRRGWC